MTRRLEDGPPSEEGDSGPKVCVRCGGALDRARLVDRLVREDNDVVLIAVRADVCPLCGEILLNPGMTGLLLEARDLVRQGRAGWATGAVYDLRRRRD